MGYSWRRILTEVLGGNRGWQPAWRDAAPAAGHDVVIGGGGHGLATAYYLARVHGPKRIAVVEKSWIGSSKVGRNTTIVNSNYLLDGNILFDEWSMQL
jgi:methylglutamate dehydrogenase subunit A